MWFSYNKPSIVNYLTILAIIFLTIINKNCVQTENLVNVYVKPKQFTGLSSEWEGKQVNSFLGIPYAKPPVGELRFRKPEPLTEYPMPINATKWPNPCQQSPVLLQTQYKSLIKNTNFSEDCLYLNIWAPVDSKVADNKLTELKPVVIWIHGGGFYSGSSNWELTDGEVLAIKADVIVVTFNYRLGWFGFMYAGSDEAPGNMGLWDQALALKWINENIVYFGGDINRITIIGDRKAGSQSVSLHLLSPITRNLFRNAIMMSGSSLSPIFKSKVEAKKMWSNIATDFGCAQQDFQNGSVNCLRQTKAVNLIESTFDKRYKTDINIIKPFIIFGDEFLPRKPTEMLRLGDYKKSARILIGNTEDEGSYVLTTFIDSQKYSLSSPQNISKSEALSELKNIFQRFFSEFNISIADIYRLYVSQLADTDYDLIRRSMGMALGDFIGTCPTIAFANALFTGDPDNCLIYQYLWSIKYDHSWHGSVYSLDIAYMFGAPYRTAPQLEISNSSEVLLMNQKRNSLRVMETIGHFARFGTPATQEGIEWQSYYTIEKTIINPYFKFTKEYFSSTDFNIGYNMKCDYLWRKYFI